MSQKKPLLSRRNFLLSAGAGSAAAAAALVANQGAKDDTRAETGDKRSSRGYTASAHVENYYRTTKV